MTRYLLALTVLPGVVLSACALGAPAGPSAISYQPVAGQGQYVRPEWLNPAPTPILPALDPCQSQTFAPLIGVNEGGIYIPGLPGDKRIIRPVHPEYFRNDFLNGELDVSPRVEVETYLSGQQLYAPTINTVEDRISIVAEDPNRLTIELDQDGYVQEVRCG